MSELPKRFDRGDRAEIVGSETVFVTVLTGPGATEQYLVKYDTGGTVLRQGWQLRSMDESLHHHFNALMTLARLLGDDKLTRVLEYAAHHVKRAADEEENAREIDRAFAAPTTTKDAVR